MRNKIFTALFALVVLAIPVLALADTEIYTYGGFNIVAQSYKRIALITSAGSFKSIFSGIAAVGMLAAGVMGLRQVIAGRSNMLIAFTSPLLGCMLFLSVIVPKETVYIFDPVLNGTTSVPGVPIGVSKIAGFANMIERAVIEILDNNPAEIGEPLYQDVGVRGFELAGQLGTISLGDENFTGTLANYVKDCVVFELMRKDSTMSFNKIWTPDSGQTLMDVLALAKNPAVYTTSLMYDGGPVGMGCDAVYNDLKTDSEALTMPALVASLNASNIPDQSAATTAMNTAIAPILDAAGISVNPDKIIAMQAIANVTTAALSSNADAAALFSVEAASAKSGLTGGVASGIVNPRMIDVYESYGLCILPILFLFVATPLCSKIISYSFSLVIWIALARVCDVIAYHNWIADYMSAAGGFNGAGLDFSFNFTQFFGSHLGQLADLRASAFLLASAISAILFKFSDSSLAHLASKASATASHASDTLDPGATARKIQDTHGGVARESAMQALAAGGGISNMARGGMANEVSSAMSGAGKIDAANNSFSNLAGKERTTGSVEAAQKWGGAAGKADAAKGDLKQVESNERTTSGVGTTAAVAGAEAKKEVAGGTLNDVAKKEHQKAAINDAGAYGNADQQTVQQAYETGANRATASTVGVAGNDKATPVQTETNLKTGQSKTQVAGATLVHQGEQTIALQGAPAGADLTGRLSSSASQARREASSEISAETDRAAKTVSEDERHGKSLDNVVSSNQSMRNDRAAQEMYLKAKQFGNSSATQNSDNYTDQQSLNKSSGANVGVNGSAGAGTGSTPGANANVGVSGGVQGGINTNKTTTGSSTTGTNSAVSESENTIKNLQKMATSTGSDGISKEQREAAQRALSYVVGSTTGHDLSQNFSKLNESSRSEQQSQELAAAFRQDSGLAFYKHLAREQYGNDGATNVTNAIADVAKQVQTEEGGKIVQAQLQQFAETMAPIASNNIAEPAKTIDHDATAQKIEQTETAINAKGEKIAVPLTGPKKTLEPTVTGPDIDAKSFDDSFNGVKKANADHTALVQEAKKDLPTNAIEATVKEFAPGLATTNTATVEGLRKGDLNREKSDGYAVGTANDYDISGAPAAAPQTAEKIVDKAGETAVAVTSGTLGTIPKIVSGLAHAVPQIMGGLSGLSTTAVAANYNTTSQKQEPTAQVAQHQEQHKSDNKQAQSVSNEIKSHQSVSAEPQAVALNQAPAPSLDQPKRATAHQQQRREEPVQQHQGPKPGGGKPAGEQQKQDKPRPQGR